ncbi:multicopper oxidase domain-containing protein [Ruegeria halocynthiae]|uniref:multicopper oxidase domain-containing protein n=1 Tax=Ruegeria halocynthiae TaxID=985054 RepID=UPI00068F0BEE|nr:multicopper oxidase domain-containing protein [Ruegeria halocynthiae]
MFCKISIFDAAGKAIQTTENVNNALVVNGVVGPVQQITPKGWVRLRLLNGSNGAFIKLTTDTGLPFQVIGSDGGFLAAPAATDVLMISPGERYDVLVDCSAGNPVTLNAVRLDDEDVSATDGIVTTQKTQPRPTPALTLQPSTQISGFSGTLPKTLATLPAADPTLAVRRRKFVLNEHISQRMIKASAGWGNTCHGEHKAMGINGRPMDMTFINERVPRGDYEIWEVTSDGGAHPFHVHECSYRILKQLGVQPPEYASGWKDMMYAGDGLTSELLVQFNYDAPDTTPYMYHCHILKHEDCGMMGQFTVGNETGYSAPIAL